MDGASFLIQAVCEANSRLEGMQIRLDSPDALQPGSPGNISPVGALVKTVDCSPGAEACRAPVQCVEGPVGIPAQAQGQTKPGGGPNLIGAVKAPQSTPSPGRHAVTLAQKQWASPAQNR